jgi:hypothetical protein
MTDPNPIRPAPDPARSLDVCRMVRRTLLESIVIAGTFMVFWSVTQAIGVEAVAAVERSFPARTFLRSVLVNLVCAGFGLGSTLILFAIAYLVISHSMARTGRDR